MKIWINKNQWHFCPTSWVPHLSLTTRRREAKTYFATPSFVPEPWTWHVNNQTTSRFWQALHASFGLASQSFFAGSFSENILLNPQCVPCFWRTVNGKGAQSWWCKWCRWVQWCERLLSKCDSNLNYHASVFLYSQAPKVGARLHPHHGYEHNYTTKYNNLPPKSVISLDNDQSRLVESSSAIKDFFRADPVALFRHIYRLQNLAFSQEVPTFWGMFKFLERTKLLFTKE